MTLQDVVSSRFKGVISKGKHEPDSAACVLEAVSIWQGKDWTDDPTILRCFDLRMLNDIDVPNDLRTPAMIRLAELYNGSLDWASERQEAVVTRIVIHTTREIIAKLPGLPDLIREQCKSATTLAVVVTALASAEKSACWLPARAARAAMAAAAWLAEWVESSGRAGMGAAWPAAELAAAAAAAARSAGSAAVAAWWSAAVAPSLPAARAAWWEEAVAAWQLTAAMEAEAAASSARVGIFLTACRIWEEAARETL